MGLLHGGAKAGAATVIHDALIRACARAYPKRRDLGVTGLTEINEGWECQVFAFTLHSEGDGGPRIDDVILRIYQGRDAARKCEGEWTALTALARGGFPVPAVFHHEIEPGVEGKPFMIMERIPGPQLADLLRPAPAPERTVLLRRFCRLFATLHALEWRPLVPNSTELETRDGITRWIGMAREITAHFGIDDVDDVLAWLEERRAGVQLAPPSVTHNDYHPWNILCPSPESLVVIDWTSAEIQDFRFDLAWTLLLATSSLGMAARDQILAEYEIARAGPVEDLGYFEVIAALRRIGDIIISQRHGAEAMGMRPGAEALMSAEDRHLRAASQLLKERTGLTISSLEPAD